MMPAPLWTVSPLFLGDALALAADNLGLSVIGVLMMFVGFELWRGKKAAGRASAGLTYIMVILVAVGALNLAGVIPTIRYDRLLELVVAGWDWIKGVL